MANITGIYVSQFGFNEQASDVATPSTGNWRVFFKSDGLYVIDDAGTVTGPLADATGGLVGCKAVSSGTAQAIATATFTAVAFGGTDEWDTDTMHDPATNNTRVTVPSTGKYAVGVSVIFDANGTGTRQLRLRKNGTTYIVGRDERAASAADLGLTAYWEADLASSDYVEVMVYQTSGGNLNVGSSADKVGFVTVRQVG